MKTLTELKKTLKIGSQLLCIAHWQEELVGTVRTVTKTQTNAYTYTVPGFVNPKGELQRMWGYYPKASDFVANSDGSFTIKLDDSRAWTLKLIDDLT